MIVRQRIWEELRLAKANIICLQKYTDRGRRKSRIFNSLIILFASAGAIGGIFKQWVAVLASFLVAFSTILKTLMPNFLHSENELSELDRLMDFYSTYFNNLEKIWYYNENLGKDESNHITESEIVERFFELKNSESDKFSALNRGVRSISKKEMNSINDEAREYVNRVYFDYGDLEVKNTE